MFKSYTKVAFLSFAMLVLLMASVSPSFAALEKEKRADELSLRLKESQDADLAYFRAFELVAQYVQVAASPESTVEHLAKSRFYIPMAKALVDKLQFFAPDVQDALLRRDLQKLAMNIAIEMDEELREKIMQNNSTAKSDNGQTRVKTDTDPTNIQSELDKFISAYQSATAILNYASVHLNLLLHNALIKRKYSPTSVETRFLLGLADSLQLVLRLNQHFFPTMHLTKDLAIFDYREALAATIVQHTNVLFSRHEPQYVRGDALRFYIASAIEIFAGLPRADNIHDFDPVEEDKFWREAHERQMVVMNHFADKMLAISSPWHWSAEHCLRLLRPGPVIPTPNSIKK